MLSKEEIIVKLKQLITLYYKNADKFILGMIVGICVSLDWKYEFDHKSNIFKIHTENNAEFIF